MQDKIKRKVVQLVSFKSAYNENLQTNLRSNHEFASNFDLVEINFEDIMIEFESRFGFKPYKEINIINKIRYLLTLNKYLINKYDHLKGSILHIQYVLPKYAFLIYFFKKTFTKTIITFWGSDVLRIDRSSKKIPLKILSWYSDIITFETKAFSDIYKKTISNKFNNKIRIVDFGIEILSIIDKITNSDIESFKQKFNINSNSKVVVIGYNKNIEQQHVKVVKSLLDSKIKKEDVFLIFPWTYGSEIVGYKDQIKDLMEDRFNYLFIENRLTDKEVAILRCCTDILVNVETTDVLSSSMLETLYAENIVITGSWLPYEDMYGIGVVMEQVDDIDEVGFKIAHLITNNYDSKIKSQNKKHIGELYIWSNCISKWVDLYK